MLSDSEAEILRGLAAQDAEKRAELRVFTDVLRDVQAEVFGDEDPLDPDLRALLVAAEETAGWTGDIWREILTNMTPVERSETWPPMLEDSAYYEVMRPKYERHVRGDS